MPPRWMTGRERRSRLVDRRVEERERRRNMAKTCAEIQPHPFFKSENGHHRRVASPSFAPKYLMPRKAFVGKVA